jgi:hypothetical protein
MFREDPIRGHPRHAGRCQLSAKADRIVRAIAHLAILAGGFRNGCEFIEEQARLLVRERQHSGPSHRDNVLSATHDQRVRVRSYDAATGSSASGIGWSARMAGRVLRLSER